MILLQMAWACEPVTMAKLVTEPTPSVLVIGMRHGTEPDLAKTRRLVRRLRTAGPVTLAFQLLDVEQQTTLDLYEKGGVNTETLPAALEWNDLGFPWEPYTGLFQGAAFGDQLLAVGHPLTTLPDGIEVSRAPGHTAVLNDSMGEHLMPPEHEVRFATHMAWLEQRMARDAIQGWSGQGTLVILADRLHVEGGKGLSYQASLLTSSPVRSILLTEPGRCYSGDRIF